MEAGLVQLFDAGMEGPEAPAAANGRHSVADVVTDVALDVGDGKTAEGDAAVGIEPFGGRNQPLAADLLQIINRFTAQIAQAVDLLMDQVQMAQH